MLPPNSAAKDPAHLWGPLVRDCTRRSLPAAPVRCRARFGVPGEPREAELAQPRRPAPVAALEPAPAPGSSAGAPAGLRARVGHDLAREASQVRPRAGGGEHDVFHPGGAQGLELPPDLAGRADPRGSALLPRRWGV